MVGEHGELGIGMVGYAFMGRAHSQAWRSVGRFFDLPFTPRMAAICGRDRSRVAAAADRLGWAAWESDWKRLVSRDDVDLVDVCTPGSSHAEISIAALEAGKHVLCEKPLSRRPEDVDRAFDVAEREGRVLAEAFMWRHHPQVARARELLDGGAIGALRIIRAHFAFPVADPDDIRLQPSLDGGGLMDVGCYCVSGCRTLAGAEPERAWAEAVPGGHGVDVALAATLRFPGDVLAHLDCGLSYPGGSRLAAAGTEGSFALADPWHGNDAVIELRRADGSVERIEAGPANSYALELADFEAAVRGERPPLLGRDDALGQARTIAALYTSAERNAPCPIA
jgi:predicted dehydrogenase